MNQAERKALREKHHQSPNWKTAVCHYCAVVYPCDVVRVLDYLDIVEPTVDINWQGGK